MKSLRNVPTIVPTTVQTFVVPNLPTYSPTIAPTVIPTISEPLLDENSLVGLWAIAAVVIPGLIIACLTKPNIIRNWVRLCSCQKRNPESEEEE